MQRLFALLCGVFLFAATVAHAPGALVSYEPFDYPANDDLSGKSGGTGWASAWSSNLTTTATDSTGDTVPSGSMLYTDAGGNTLVTSGNSGLFAGTFAATGDGATSQAFRRLSELRGADNTTTWLSFVGQRQGNKSGDPPSYQRGTNVSLFNSTLAASQEQLAIGEGSGRAEDTWSLVPEGSAANTQASTTPFDQQSLIVVRIDHKAGNDDAYLFVNPRLGLEPDIATASARSVGAHDFSFDTVRPFAGNSQGAGATANGIIQMDEFRVGDTYADVTPVVPEPAGAGLVVLGLLAAAGRRCGRRVA